MTGRSIVVERFGGPDVMRPRDIDVPEPQAREALVRVQACGVARADVAMRAGRYPRGPRPPFVPGWDVAGIVEEIGDQVPRWWLGRRVVSLVLSGGYTTHVRIRVRDLVPVPDSVDLTMAACLPLNYVTAHQMLHRIAEVRTGDRILVRGASGGVGTALLDLARRAGVVAVGSASERGRQVVESFGARFVEDARGRSSADEVRPDVVFDGVGGPGLTGSLRAIRPGGRVVTFGFSSASGAPWGALLGQGLRILTWSALPNGIKASGYRLSQAARRDPELVRDDLEVLVHELAAGRVHPLIADVLPLERAADAHHALERRAVRGKLLLNPVVS